MKELTHSFKLIVKGNANSICFKQRDLATHNINETNGCACAACNALHCRFDIRAPGVKQLPTL